MYNADQWKDYELLDTGDGEKLERWGSFRAPQARSPGHLADRERDRPVDNSGRPLSPQLLGRRRMGIPHEDAGSLVGLLRRAEIPHPADQLQAYGLVPEQAVNWSWMMDKIRNAGRPIDVFNLFAYTGGATVAAAAAGAEVCHVDAAKGMVQWAKENAELSGLERRPDPLHYRRRVQIRAAGATPRQASMMRSSWIRPPTGAARTAKCGSWRKICIRSSNPARAILSAEPALRAGELVYDGLVAYRAAQHAANDDRPQVQGHASTAEKSGFRSPRRA